MTDTAAIHVGADPEAIAAARNGILDILNTSRDEATVQDALRVFSQVCAVHHVTIQHCNITMPPMDPSKAVGFMVDSNPTVDDPSS